MTLKSVDINSSGANRYRVGADALVIDTETDRGGDARPIQVATINATTGFEWMAYFNSGRAISALTTRVHGITDADVAGLPRFELAKFEVSEYLIGHNVRFDWRVIGRPKAKLICTVRLARQAFPEWRGYSQSRCIEQLLGGEQAVSLTAHAHDALGDARMCYRLYLACCARLGIAAHDYAEAHRVANTAKPTQRMPFGKYKGKKISELPPSYARWMLNNASGLTPGVHTALQQRLQAATPCSALDKRQ